MRRRNFIPSNIWHLCHILLGIFVEMFVNIWLYMIYICWYIWIIFPVRKRRRNFIPGNIWHLCHEHFLSFADSTTRLGQNTVQNRTKILFKTEQIHVKTLWLWWFYLKISTMMLFVMMRPNDVCKFLFSAMSGTSLYLAFTKKKRGNFSFSRTANVFLKHWLPH